MIIILQSYPYSGQSCGVTVAPVGRTIYAIFSRIGYCYRIGGDEFAAITTIPVREADAMMYERKRRNKGLRQ